MLVTSELSKSFGPIKAVDQISLKAEAGEVLGVLGPNGAGKTTFSRLIATLLSPTSGTATVDGHDIIKEAEKVRQVIGFLPTEPGLYGRFTAVENLRYFGRLHSMDEKDLAQRIDYLLKKFDLYEERDRRTAGFSKGMMQKVSLIRSVLHDPKVLLLDEPTAGLDVPAARVVLDMVKEFKAEGKCILFSTHRMAEAEKICDRMVIIAKGRIVAQGTVAELRQQAGQDDLEEIFLRLVGEAS
ncbi:MAG: ABC transporter ATP-binding protein [Bacillota bacterium]